MRKPTVIVTLTGLTALGQFAGSAFADEIIPQGSLAGTIWASTDSHDRTTIGGVVDRLVEKGLVARAVNSKDRRARELRITDAGAEMLAQEARMRRAQGGGLYLHKLKDDARELLVRGGYMDDIGRVNVFESKAETITSVFERLDRGICVRCDKRIFLECREVPRVEIEDAPEPADAAPATPGTSR